MVENRTVDASQMRSSVNSFILIRGSEQKDNIEREREKRQLEMDEIEKE